MMFICDFITSIPDVIWSGVIASLLTLSGVLLSNHSNTNRLKLSLQHDSEEKAKQRKVDLRKNVYLLTAEELVKANAHLMSLPQIDPSKANVGEGLQGLFAAATKLQMISEEKTSLLVGDLIGTYSELLLKAISKVQPIHKLQIEINICNDQYNHTQSEISRILAAMAQFNESAQTDHSIFTTLNNSFTFWQEEAKKFAEKRSILWKQRNTLHKSFVKEFMAEMKIGADIGIRVMIEIRRELDVGGNIDNFMLQMEKQGQRISEQMEVFLNSLDQN